MSGSDKASNRVQRVRGKAKEAIGRAIGDPALEHQGGRDQRRSHLKDAGEKVKAAFRRKRRRQQR